MNAHALAAAMTRPPPDETTNAWVAHTAAVDCTRSALVGAIESAIEEQRQNATRPTAAAV